MKSKLTKFSVCFSFCRRNDAAKHDECSANGTATATAYATNGNATTNANDATTRTHDKYT